MLHYNIYEWLIKFGFTFSVFSVAGWVLEVIYRSLSQMRFVNPGMLHGPYLPLYGTGALLLMRCVCLIGNSSIMMKIIVYLSVTTGLELFAGFVSQKCFHNLLWDYSNEWLNYKGYICLKFSIYWVFLAFLFEYLILPLYLKVIQNLPLPFLLIVSVAGTVCILTEFVIALRRGRFNVHATTIRHY